MPQESVLSALTSWLSDRTVISVYHSCPDAHHSVAYRRVTCYSAFVFTALPN
jgi:hypothetical protein